MAQARDMIVSALIGGGEVRRVSLNSFGKAQVSFGRAQDNDICLNSPFVSEHHGFFVLDTAGGWNICDNKSRNGIYTEDLRRVERLPVGNGGRFFLGNPQGTGSGGVCFAAQAVQGQVPQSQIPTGPVSHNQVQQNSVSYNSVSQNQAAQGQVRQSQVRTSGMGSSSEGTVRAPRNVPPASGGRSVSVLSVFDGEKPVYTVDLVRMGKTRISFGHQSDNDIVLTSEFASRRHGSISFENGQCIVRDEGSRNGLLYGSNKIQSLAVTDGMVIRIDDPNSPLRRGVSLLFTAAGGEHWDSMDLNGRNSVVIGRDTGCDLRLDHVSVSRRHARIVRDGSGWYIEDLGSTNGVSVNGRVVDRRMRLNERDLIIITNVKLVFTSSRLSWLRSARGIRLDAIDIVRTVGKGAKRKNISDHISLSIKPGEFVAIIGTSGAGKSTFLNCISGYVRADAGRVLVNGEDLYQNYQVMKSIIGYVPQQDIVYDNLTLRDMLTYAARLRMPSDTGKAEIDARVAKVISTVELTGHEATFIGKLSGGQKKRASIGVELLSDPSLFFLDEPTSGLDPGTERNLMHTLRTMTSEGKTIVLVTHNTMNLHLCDKIIFLGNGGRLCFCGAPDDALKFFGVENLVDVYSMLERDSKSWSAKYASSPYVCPPEGGRAASGAGKMRKKNQPFFRQLGILCARYLKLLTNDRQRLVLLLAQAVLLAVLIWLVSDGEQFEKYTITKSIMFALACSAFWIGVLNAIQEICKERVILKREYANSLSLGAYILSKFFVLGLFCLVQTVLLTGTFAALVGLPEEGLIMPPILEMAVTTYLCMLSAMGMGLLVSSMFNNPDRAMTVAPILLMPQILFSGLAFKLTGAVEKLSMVVTCRWAVEAYGTSANLNELPIDYDLPEGFPTPEREIEEIYEFVAEHLWNAWGVLLLMLLVFTVACILMTKYSLSKNK